MNNRAGRRDAAGVIPAWESIADWDDLLKEILVRLPAKSTIRFRKVSKHWLNLLSDSQFATNHSTQNPAPSSISGFYFYLFGTLYHLYSLTLPGFGGNLPPLSFLDGLPTVSVKHSSNGLLLCHFMEVIDGFRQVQNYLVCNPTTKKYKLLPECVGLGSFTDGFLAFDPTKSPLQYKVILVSHQYSKQINIYSSQSLCWKMVSPGQTYVGRSVFWNRAIHWLRNDNSLSRFDMDVEKIIAIPNPPSPQNLHQKETMYFGECGGGLILIQSASRWPSEFKILELEKDYSRWVIKCMVDLRPLETGFPKMERRLRSYKASNNLQAYSVLGAVEGENGRGVALILAFSSRIICYHLKDMTWDVLRDLVPGELGQFYLPIPAFPFVETFFPV